MHEFSIVQSLIQQIEEYLDSNNYQKVITIQLEVGEMSGVIVDALEFAYDICSKGTKIESAKLCISVKPVTAACEHCHSEFTVHDYSFLCPQCQSPDLKLLSGTELRIKALEVEG